MDKRKASARSARSDPFVRAFRFIEKHPQVRRVGPLVDRNDGAKEVDVDFEVNLPSAWLAAGQSGNGVRNIETVRFHFPRTYPLDAPKPSLRPDFDRSHPHIQPYLLDDRVLPCIADIPLSDLLHTEGLRGILNQTAIWLDNAALGTLDDPSAGLGTDPSR